MSASPLASRRTVVTSLALLVLASTLLGCPGQKEVNEVDQHATLTPTPAGYWVGYTSTKFSQSIPAGKHVYLLSATLTSSSGEFTWASSMTGTAGQGDGATVVLQKTSFADATTGGTTSLDVVDTGDLLPLYPTQDFRVDWVIEYSPSLAQAYPNGLDLTFTYQLDIK